MSLLQGCATTALMAIESDSFTHERENRITLEYGGSLLRFTAETLSYQFSLSLKHSVTTPIQS
jgi:hypothetical protein